MTVGQRIFYLLEEKKMTQVEFSRRSGIATTTISDWRKKNTNPGSDKMTQVEFSRRSGIATTTISDWRKKNTNPGSDKIMQICAALEVTPEYLLSGVCEDSDRGKSADYLVIPKGTDERKLLEFFNDMPWMERTHLLSYAEKLSHKGSSYKTRKKKN